MSFLASLVLPCVLSIAQDPMGGSELIEEAWRHLPVYDFVQRPFLSEDEQRETQAAAHLLEAALVLHPGHLRGLWSLGYAELLLAGDRRSRGASEAAGVHYERGMAALARAVELHPFDPWAFHARAAARTTFGDHAGAKADLEAAVAAADAVLTQGTDPGSMRWLRFKALELQPEVLMRGGEFGPARAALRAFHGEFSESAWPLLVALGESHLRQGDLAGAREVYAELLDSYPDETAAHMLLCQLEGLRGDREAALTHLTDALAREPAPRVSTRRWLAILATENAAGAHEQLASIVASPPEGADPWELAFSRLLLGHGEVQAFLDAARAEEQRRKSAGEALAWRMCAVWFHAGLRLEQDAAAATDDATRESLLTQAREAYATALSYEPPTWSWERAYAGRHLAALESR